MIFGRWSSALLSKLAKMKYSVLVIAIYGSLELQGRGDGREQLPMRKDGNLRYDPGTIYSGNPWLRESN